MSGKGQKGKIQYEKRQKTYAFPGSKGTVWSKLLKLLRMLQSKDVSNDAKWNRHATVTDVTQKAHRCCYNKNQSDCRIYCYALSEKIDY